MSASSSFSSVVRKRFLQKSSSLFSSSFLTRILAGSVKNGACASSFKEIRTTTTTTATTIPSFFVQRKSENNWCRPCLVTNENFNSPSSSSAFRRSYASSSTELMTSRTSPTESAQQNNKEKKKKNKKKKKSSTTTTTSKTKAELEELKTLMDMKKPGKWYPLARTMQREIILHVGPTNSGKTHAAMERLKRASSGVYCSPLRLLAWEISESLNKFGTKCDLVTGQELKRVENAEHIACTVEMVDVNKVVDCAVIDEIHLIGDDFRVNAYPRWRCIFVATLPA